jgi:hypothetical protein
MRATKPAAAHAVLKNLHATRLPENYYFCFFHWAQKR